MEPNLWPGGVCGNCTPNVAEVVVEANAEFELIEFFEFCVPPVERADVPEEDEDFAFDFFV